MSTTWLHRKERLGILLGSGGDEIEEGLALDRLLHGQSVIGKTAKTVAVEAVRFTHKDFSVVGTLEYGQYSVIDVVKCTLDGSVHVRKSIEKKFAYKTRDTSTGKRYSSSRSRNGLCVDSPSLLCLSDGHASESGHELCRRWNPLGCTGIQST